MSISSTQDKYEISPSDLNQSIVRVVFVSGVVIWSFINSAAVSISDALSFDYFVLSANYWLFSLAFFTWTLFVLRKVSAESILTIMTRAVGIIADLGAISAYTAISGQHGVILYPIYLTCIIGYGYRFGIRYLYLSILVGTVFFSIALGINEDLSRTGSLVLAYYLGLLLVPIYLATLLRKHREVLERLKEVNEARSRFIANMSHELRTPLHAIISVTDILEEEAGTRSANKDDQQSKLRMVGDSAQHLLSLVNRVLDVASAEAGRGISAKFERIAFYQVFLTALRICEPKALEKNVAFYWYIDPNIPEFILSSGEHLQEVLINTVGNAVKYTRSGYVSVRATVKSVNGASLLSINVVDTGIGISAKLLPTIFEPFTLGDDTAIREYAGTGLGLTITKQYVEYLGGKISYESTENVGTKCVIEFQISHAHEKRQHEKLSRLIPAVIVSPNKLAENEIEAFEFAGWHCKVTSNLDIDTENSEEAPVIFIDEYFEDRQDAVILRLGTIYPTSLLVTYAIDESHIYPKHLSYNCSVRRGNTNDLGMVRSLALAANKRRQKDSVEAAVARESPLEILVADDNSANLKTALLALESVGHSVVTVTSGDDVLNDRSGPQKLDSSLSEIFT